MRVKGDKLNRTIQITTYYQIVIGCPRDEMGVRVCRECHSECAVMRGILCIDQPPLRSNPYHRCDDSGTTSDPPLAVQDAVGDCPRESYHNLFHWHPMINHLVSSALIGNGPDGCHVGRHFLGLCVRCQCASTLLEGWHVSLKEGFLAAR